ncbi:Signal peptidase complex subunit 3, partial [Orchesella cincta]
VNYGKEVGQGQLTSCGQDIEIRTRARPPSSIFSFVTRATPFQRNTEDEDEEVDSDEVEETDNLRNVVNNLGSGGTGNLTDAELAEKASKFLAQYIAQSGGIGAGGVPLLQVPNQNSTIIIALVDGKNASQLQQTPTQAPFLTPDAYPFLFPTVQSQPELVGDFLFREQQSTSSPLQVAPAPTFQPFYLNPSYFYPTASTSVISTKPPLPPSSEQVGVDNIEDAILEALLVAQEATTLPTTNQGQQFQQIQLPASALNQVYNLSAFGLLQNNLSSFNPADLGLQAFLLNPYIPPSGTVQNSGVPPGANPQLHAIAGLFGSLAQGNLAGVVQSSLKLAGTGILQNVAHSTGLQTYSVIMAKLGSILFIFFTLALAGLKNAEAFKITMEKPEDVSNPTQPPINSEEFRKWIHEQEEKTFLKVIEKISSPNDTYQQHEAKIAVARYLVNVTFTAMTRRLERLGRGAIPETPSNFPSPAVPESNPTLDNQSQTPPENVQFPVTQSHVTIPGAPDNSPYPITQSHVTIPGSNPYPATQSHVSIPTVPENNPFPVTQSLVTIPGLLENNPSPVSQSHVPVPTVPENNPFPVTQSHVTIPGSNPYPATQSHVPVPTVPENNPFPVTQSHDSQKTIPLCYQSHVTIPGVPENNPFPITQSHVSIPGNNPYPATQSHIPIPGVTENNPSPVIQSQFPIPGISENNLFPITQSHIRLPAAQDTSNFNFIPQSNDPLSTITLANKTSASSPFSPTVFVPPASPALASLPSSATNENETTTTAPDNSPLSALREILGLPTSRPGGLFANFNISALPGNFSLPGNFNISRLPGNFSLSRLPGNFSLSRLPGNFNISAALAGNFNRGNNTSSPGNFNASAILQTLNIHAPPEGLFNVPTPPPKNDSVRMSQMFLEHQVEKLVEDINMQNISGIVDRTANIATPQTVGVLVNALLNVVLCNPLDRFYGNLCYHFCWLSLALYVNVQLIAFPPLSLSLLHNHNGLLAVLSSIRFQTSFSTVGNEHLIGGENGLTYQNQQVSREDVKAYLQPILYQKLLRQHGDSAVIQQTKTVVSEYLVESLLDSAQRPAEPVRSEEFARQNNNGTTAGATTRRPLFGNLTRPSEAHVIGQVDQIIQNVNVGNITGIVDQALRIRAPAPVQQLVNSIMNLWKLLWHNIPPCLTHLIIRHWVLVATFFVHYIQADENNAEIIDMTEFQPIEDKVLDQLMEPNDGPFEKKIKKLLAEYIVASAVETVSNFSAEASGRAIQQQPQIIYVYGTPPPTPRTRRTRPPTTPRTPRTRRTRRPPNNHNHESSEERPQQQNLFMFNLSNLLISHNINQPRNSLLIKPQYQPAPQQPASQPQPQQEVPIYQPSGQPQQPSQSAPAQQITPVAPQQVQPSAPILQPQPPPQQVQQVVYLGTTPAVPTGPTTTPRPRPSQEHVYNQVNKILDNVGTGNIQGIVDSALGIRTPAPTRNFVNGILSTVFCNPINLKMYRSFERLNVVVTYGIVVLAVSAIALNLTTYSKDFSNVGPINFKAISASIKNSSWSYDVDIDGSHDTAFLVLDAHADLSSLFNWNVKQLFVSVVVEYTTKTHVRNEVVIWDKIIVRGQNPMINTKYSGNRYLMWDDGNGLRGLQAKWRLKWNVIRNVGPLGSYQSAAYDVKFPDEYSRHYH